MGLQATFDVLSALIERCESGGLTVRSVEAVTDGPEGGLEANLTLPLPLGTGGDRTDHGRLADARVSAEDSLEVTYRLPDLASYEPERATVSTRRRSARVTDGGEVVVDVVLGIRPPQTALEDRETPDATQNSSNGDPVSADPSGETERATTNGHGGHQGSSTDDRAAARAADTDDESRRPGIDDAGTPGDSTGPTSPAPRERDAGGQRHAGGEGHADGQPPDADADADGQDGDRGLDDSDHAHEEEPTRTEVPRDESVPPYEDTRYLEALYESCDTFAEMSRRIEMDVSAETVRRYCIDAGVHEPDSYDTASRDAAAVEATLPDAAEVADAIDLPDGPDLADVVDAVAGARSVHEVARELEVERERARELLTTLDIIDLVSYRLTDVPEGPTSPEEIATRIKRRIPEGA